MNKINHLKRKVMFHINNKQSTLLASEAYVSLCVEQNQYYFSKRISHTQTLIRCGHCTNTTKSNKKFKLWKL